MQSLKDAMKQNNFGKLPEYVDVVLEAFVKGRIIVVFYDTEKQKLCRQLVAHKILEDYPCNRGFDYRLTESGIEIAKHLKQEFEIPAVVVQRIHENLRDVGFDVGEEVEGDYRERITDRGILEESIEKQGGVLIDYDEEDTNIRFNIGDLKNSVNLPHRIKKAWIDIGEKSLLAVEPKNRAYFAEWNTKDGDFKLLARVMRESGFKWMPEIVGSKVKKHDR